MTKLWEDMIALNSADEPVFDVLPKAADLTDRRSWSVDVEKTVGAKGLDWYLERDQSPLPVAEDREGYFGDRNFEYWMSGLETHNHIVEISDQLGADRKTFVDLGAASGRVIRHIDAYRSFEESWAFDINWRHIAWINRYLPSTIRAVQTSSIPTLPLEAQSVDFLVAMSVFSHIESFELHWLAEVRRIMRPNGVALVSVVTEKTLDAMDETWPMYLPYTNHPAWGPDFREELLKRGKRVLRWHADRSYSSNVIYSTEYIENVFGRFFHIEEIRHQFPIYQDSLILRRR